MIIEAQTNIMTYEKNNNLATLLLLILFPKTSFSGRLSLKKVRKIINLLLFWMILSFELQFDQNVVCFKDAKPS